MAEPPTRTLPQTGAGGGSGLLATKLYVPRSLPGHVPRPQLLERLTEGLARGLVLVCAPAGFGKTSLLADWASHARQPVAWLTLDQGDNDPVRFWRHVAAALDRSRSGVAEQVDALLGSPPASAFEGPVTALINRLAEEPDPLLLVLDDYHLVESRPVHASVGFLLEHRPPGLGLVLAGRADPPLPLARLRARGQLTELRAADLRFTPEETAALLRQTADLELPEAAVTALTARTEGWAAGLQLAALSLQDQPDTAGFLASFSGGHRFVLDYLTEEVLDLQPEPVVRFLLETSILDRLSGPLCDAVTGRGGSQPLLEAIERANLFLHPLDEVRGWWRYHQLFADLLRARLQQQQPERVPELHRAAAAWSQAHGLAEDAVRHALAAGDPTWAARLIEGHADELLLRSEGTTLRRWLEALPAELVRSRPRLGLTQARLDIVSRRVEAADGLLDSAERALADAGGEPDEPFEPSVGRAASLLANIPATIALERGLLAELRGDAEATIAFASQTQALLGEGEWMLASLARTHLAVAEWLRGRLPEAERAFAANVARWRATGEAFPTAWSSYQLAEVQRAQGRLDAALATHRQALEQTTVADRQAVAAAAMARIGIAEVAYQRDDLDEAQRQLDEGIALCRELTHPQPLATGLALLAWVRQVSGDPDGAREAIADAERVALGPEVAGLLNPVPAQRARLLLAQGDLAGAARWTQERGLGPGDQASYQHEREQLVLARVLLAQDRPDQALVLLDRLDVLARAQQRTGSRIEVQALRALAQAGLGDEAAAVASLTEGLTLAHPQGHVRVFADEGAPMGALLGRLFAAQRSGRAPAGSVPLRYLGRLVRSFHQDEPPARPGAAVPGLVEPLSERELEVLRLLAAGKPNQEIAEDLVVALNTVKKHVSHVLDKLGAANRTEATARARELGLLG